MSAPATGVVAQLPLDGEAETKITLSGSVSTTVTFAALAGPLSVAVTTYVSGCPDATGFGVPFMETVTSARQDGVARGSGIFVRFGSAMALEMIDAVFERAPPSPPGRTCATIVGQFTSVVQFGRLGIVQVSFTPVLPDVAVDQLTPLALFAVVTKLMKPAPVGPVKMLISVWKSSEIVMFVDACVVLLFTTSSVYVSTSPAATVGRSTAC